MANYNCSNNSRLGLDDDVMMMNDDAFLDGIYYFAFVKCMILKIVTACDPKVLHLSMMPLQIASV